MAYAADGEIEKETVQCRAAPTGCKFVQCPALHTVNMRNSSNVHNHSLAHETIPYIAEKNKHRELDVLFHNRSLFLFLSRFVVSRYRPTSEKKKRRKTLDSSCRPVATLSAQCSACNNGRR